MDLVDYIYYIFLPLKYHEYDNFFSRWQEFMDDIRHAQFRKKNRKFQSGYYFHYAANKKREILAQELISAINHNCYDIKVLAINHELMAFEKRDYNLGLSPDSQSQRTISIQKFFFF